MLAGRVRQLNAALTQCWVTSPWRRQHQCLKYEACSSPIHTQAYRLSNRLSQLNAALSPVTLVEKTHVPSSCRHKNKCSTQNGGDRPEKNTLCCRGSSTMHCFLLGCQDSRHLCRRPEKTHRQELLRRRICVVRSQTPDAATQCCTDSMLGDFRIATSTYVHDKSKYEACSGPRKKKSYRVSQLNAALSQVTLVRKDTSDFCMPAYTSMQ